MLGQTRRGVLAAAAAAAAMAPAAHADGLEGVVEPRMRLGRRSSGPPRVAITLDACPGGFDPRVASALVQASAPATIFVSGPWMRRNRDGLAFLLAHPDVFSLQNHGALHLACVLGARRIWGLTPAGDLDQVRAEVEGGARDVAEATGRRPTWFRGAGAIYSPAALPLIRSLGFEVAGFSLNGDVGASLPAWETAARIGAASDGDVVISHINQPRRASGAGVAAGIWTLKRNGVLFVRLDALGRAGVAYG